MADLQAVLKTNRGDITVNLLPNHAPETVDNFVGLAEGTKDYNAGNGRSGPFYDGLGFHRVIREKVDADVALRGVKGCRNLHPDEGLVAVCHPAIVPSTAKSVRKGQDGDVRLATLEQTMDDVKAMTRAGETVGKAVGSGWRSARRNAKRAGLAGAEATSRAAHAADRKLTEHGLAPRQVAEALAESAEVARQEVAKTTRRARRKLAKTAKHTRKDLAKAAKQARKDAAKSKTAKRATKSAKQAKADAKKLKSQVKADVKALKAKAAGEKPKSKRRWPKVMLLVIVASGVAYVVRGKAMAQDEQPVPEPRRDETAKPDSTKPDAAANAQLNGQHQKSSSAKN